IIWSTTVVPEILRGGPSPTHRDFLCTPVPDLPDAEIVFRPGGDAVDHAEFLRHLARLPELADDLAVQADLVDLPVVHALRIVRVRRVEILIGAAGDADRLRRADVRNLRLEGPLAVEDLNAVVAGIGHVDRSEERRVGKE